VEHESNAECEVLNQHSRVITEQLAYVGTHTELDIIGLPSSASRQLARVERVRVASQTFPFPFHGLQDSVVR